MSHSVGSNGGGEQLNSGYSRAQLEEMKAFNAGLTRAGNKARPGRGRGSAAIRNPPSRASPPRSAISGAGPGGLVARFAAGNRGAARSPTNPPTTLNPPVFKGNNSPPKNHGSSLATMTDPYSAGLVKSATSNFGAPPTSTATTSSNNFGSATPYNNGNNFNVPDAATTPSVPNHGTQAAPPPGRELIVTNWTEDDGKPWIPAHLHQISATEAIKEMAEMTGTPFEEMTVDGITIPRPRGGVVYKPYTAPEPALAQPSVDPTGWFMAATARPATGSAPQGHARIPSTGAMDVDYDEGHSPNTGATGAWALAPAAFAPAPPTTATIRGGTLADSKWATPSWNHGPEAKKENVRPIFGQSTASQSLGAQAGNSWSTGSVPSWQIAAAQFAASPSAPSAPALKPEKTLKDSRWAN